MKKLRLALIGVGGMGTGHLVNHLANPKVELVAICDILPGRCEERVEQYKLEGVKTYTDYKACIEENELDAVDVCTPNDFHSIIAVYALDKGLNVFTEKPDAMNVEEVMKMYEAYKRSGKVLMVMRNNRYYSNSKYLKQYIADGKAGEIYCGRCGWIRRRGIPGRGGWFTTKAKSGGGPLIDLGVHMIDLSIWLMGNPTPVAVSGSIFSKFSGNEAESDSANSKFGDAVSNGTFDVEDLAMGFIKFDNGACLQIEFSWASNIQKEERFVELRGTKSGFRWNDNGTVDIYTEDEHGTLVDLHPSLPDMGNGHGQALQHFVDIILEGKEKDYVPEQGVNMIKILSAIYESAKTGKEVSLI